MRPLSQDAAVLGMVLSAGLLLYGLFGHPLRDRNRLRHRGAILQMKQFLTALEKYRADCKQYPTTVEGLEALAGNPGVKGWSGPYVAPEVPLDPWGNPYRYDYTPERNTVEITSYGADGQPGGHFFNTDISSRNLNAGVPESPDETRARRILIGSTAAACAGLVASFFLWGLAARRYAADE